MVPLPTDKSQNLFNKTKQALNILKTPTATASEIKAADKALTDELLDSLSLDSGKIKESQKTRDWLAVDKVKLGDIKEIAWNGA